MISAILVINTKALGRLGACTRHREREREEGKESHRARGEGNERVRQMRERTFDLNFKMSRQQKQLTVDTQYTH